jgi:hypothetical protein
LKYSFFIFFLVDGFLSGQFILAVNDLVSEFIECLDDLSHDVLIAEVLVGSKGNEGFKEGGHLGLVLDFLFDLLE